MQGHTQTGPKTENNIIFLIFCCLLIIIIMIFFIMNNIKPNGYVIHFKYKSNFFVEPDFTDYDFKTVGKEKYNWHVDERGLGKICSFFYHSIGWMNKVSKRKSRVAVRALEDWIAEYLTLLQDTDIVNENFQGFPWGNNWYEFSIESTRLLAYYLVLRHKLSTISQLAAQAIKLIIIDPKHSLGYNRDKANSAMMVFPWTLAHNLTGTLDKTNEAYIYAVDQYDITPRQDIKANEDGIHLDWSYLTHGGVYAFGYLDSIYAFYPDTVQVIRDLPDLSNDIDIIHSKLRHKTISVSGCTLWNRQRNLNSYPYSGKRVTPTCVVIPSMRYIRMFGEDYQWCARTMQQSVAYYESDHTVFDMGLYSALCRRVFRKGDSTEVKFPEAGFIYPAGTTKLIETPSTNTTTTPFFCQLLNTSKSFVWTDGVKYGILFQYQMKLPPLVKGMFSEVLCINLETETIDTHYRLEETNMTLFTGNKEYTRINGNNVDSVDGYIRVNTDLKTGTYTEALGTNNTSNGSLLPRVHEFTNGEYRDDELYDSARIIQKKVNGNYVNHSYCPAENDKLKESITANGTTFYFSNISNQYRASDFLET